MAGVFVGLLLVSHRRRVGQRQSLKRGEYLFQLPPPSKTLKLDCTCAPLCPQLLQNEQKITWYNTMTGRENITLFNHKEDSHVKQLQLCALSSSRGKDSLLALDRAVRQGFSVDFLVTMYDEASQRVRFHGVPITLIQAQADALGIPLLSYPNASETFETVFLQSLRGLRQRKVGTMLFGNIHLAGMRA